MVEFLAKIAGRDVIASGSLVWSPNDKAALLKIADLLLHIRFENTDDKKLDVSIELENDKSLYLTIKNFGQLGASYSTIIGHLDNRALHLSFYAHSTSGDNPARLLNYTFSLGEVADGKQI